MNCFAQGLHYRPILIGDCLPRIVRKKSLLLGLDQTGVLELREVAAQVGLVEFQDCFKVTNAKSLRS